MNGACLKNNLWEKLEELMVPLNVEASRKKGREEVSECWGGGSELALSDVIAP